MDIIAHNKRYLPHEITTKVSAPGYAVVKQPV